MGKTDFIVDLATVFSVVKPDELVANANSYYQTNIILPEPGSKFDSYTKNGDIQKFHLYRITMRRIDAEEKRIKNIVSDFETLTEPMGVFTNLYETMVCTDSITIFSNLEDADLFLRASLRSDSKLETKTAYFCTDTAMDGLES